MTQNVVCFGDSLTRGLISVNYLEILTRRFADQNYRFVNCGINNDYAYNLVLRADQVIAENPQFITILIGTNDVIATLSSSMSWAGSLLKKLPERPSLPWFRHKLREVVTRLKTETAACLAVLSLPVLGEDLNSTPNERVRQFNSAIQEIAIIEEIKYLPVYEHLVEILHACHGEHGRVYRFSFRPTMQSAQRRFLLRESLDEFSQRKGYRLLTDGVHLNSRGAGVIADEIEAFIRSYPLAGS